MKIIKERLGKFAAVIVFFVFTVVLYGPFSIYLPNAEELWITVPMISAIVLPVTLVVLLFLFGLSLIAPDKGHHILLKLFFGLALALYLQGNFININYGSGVQDGTEIIWKNYRTYAILDTLAWIVCFAIPFIIDLVVKRNEKKFYQVITLASLFFTIIQVPAFVSQAVTFQPNESVELNVTKNNMFEIGEKENILMFVLDTMDEAYYQTFIDAHPEYTDILEGFVHYDNTAAAGSRTLVGLTAMFTGTPYTRQDSYTEYLKKVWSQKNVFSVLNDAGYEVDVYSEAMLFSMDTLDYVENFSNESDGTVSTKILAKKLLKMDLYKYLPHVLKQYFWYDTAELNDAIKAKDRYKLNDVTFYKDFSKHGFTTDGGKEKVFQVYHLDGAHSPYTMNEFGKKEKSTREQTVAGHFYCIGQMLDQLREMGLYDSSTILITADHGDKDMGEHMMLLIKEAGATGEYRTSSAPISGFDLTIYLASLGGQTLDDQRYGEELASISENAERERHFFWGTSDNSRLQVQEYTTTEYAGNKKNWTLTETFEDQAGGPVELGTKLSFAADATANDYTVEGFGGNTGYRTKMYGPRGEIAVPIADLPEAGAVKVTLELYHSKSYAGMPIRLSANGMEIFDGEINTELQGEGLVFSVPVDSFGDDQTLFIGLDFPDVDQSEMELKVTKRTETISVVSLLIEEAA